MPLPDEERMSPEGGTGRGSVARTPSGDEVRAGGAPLTGEQVWHEVARASFAVLGYVTPTGEPRSSGVVYKVLGRRLYVAVAPDSWKAKDIVRSGRIAVVVPVRRGGILSLVFPIPPATISFHGAAVVHQPNERETSSLLQQLGSLLPAERRTSAVLIEIVPEDGFLTYGIGVSLRNMRNPACAVACRWHERGPALLNVGARSSPAPPVR